MTSASADCIKESFSKSPTSLWFLSVFPFFLVTREVHAYLHIQCFQNHLQNQTQQITSSVEKERTSFSVRNVSLMCINLASFPEIYKYSTYFNSKQE